MCVLFVAEGSGAMEHCLFPSSVATWDMVKLECGVFTHVCASLAGTIQLRLTSLLYECDPGLGTLPRLARADDRLTYSFTLATLFGTALSS